MAWAGAIATCIALGCVYRAPIEDPEALAQLSLLEPGGVNRATIEARVGPPEQIFEGGAVVAYRLVNFGGFLLVHGSARRLAHSSERAHYWLMLEYGTDGVLVGRSLVPGPPEPE